MANKTLSAILVVVMIASAFAVVISDSQTSDGATGYDVTDGKGYVVHFDNIPKHLITIGKGITATAIQLDDLDRIVVCDSYSKADKNSIFDELRTAVDDGKIAANGNVYNSGKDNLIADIVNAADNKEVFDKTRDVIVITGSDTYVLSIVDTLKEYGFEKILQWNDITEYSKISDYVAAVSLAFDGKVSSYAQEMNDLSYAIEKKVEGKEKAKAFYVTYSGNAFKVGNTGSLANSMIIAAGGDSVTVDSSKKGSTYEASIPEIIEKNPGVIVFADNSIMSDETKLAQLKTQVGDSKIFGLNSLWNNYSIASMDGVEAMYSDMYDESPLPDSEGNSSALIIGGTIAVIVVIAAVAIFFMRKN